MIDSQQIKTCFPKEISARRAYSNSVGQRPTEMVTTPTARPEGAGAIIAQRAFSPIKK